MIKRESGVITRLSREVNGLSREDVVGGMHLVERINEDLEVALYEKNKVENKVEKEIER